MRIWIVIGIILLIFCVSLAAKSAKAFYPFGGLITMIYPLPIPFGPCYFPAIQVGPPMPGLFVLPPASLFAFYAIHPGAFVFGNRNRTGMRVHYNDGNKRVGI